MIIQIVGNIINARIIGKLSFVDVMTLSGVGYRIYVGSETFNSIGAIDFQKDQNVTLYTSLIVREDSQTLYGFENIEKRDLFESLLGVSGVGPRTALSIVDTFTINDFYSLVEKGDYSSLTKVSGLGTKGAQKIILDIKGKVDLNTPEKKSNGKVYDGKRLQVYEALISLGLKREEAQKIITQMGNQFDDASVTLNDLIAQALRSR